MIRRWYRRMKVALFDVDPTEGRTEDMPAVDPGPDGQLRDDDGLDYVETEAEALAREHAKALAEIETRTKTEMDAIFGPLQDAIDDVFLPVFDRAEKAAGLGEGWVYGFYVDAVRIEAEAQEFAREVATNDRFAAELKQLLLAEAMLIS